MRPLFIRPKWLKSNESAHFLCIMIAIAPQRSTVAAGQLSQSDNNSSCRLYFFLFLPMATGTVKTKTDKGFGFIKMEGSPDVFFHNSACPNGDFESLDVGQTVSFDLQQGDKGPKAVNVVAGEALAA